MPVQKGGVGTCTRFMENIEAQKTTTMKNENVKGINRGKSVSLMFIFMHSGHIRSCVLGTHTFY